MFQLCSLAVWDGRVCSAERVSRVFRTKGKWQSSTLGRIAGNTSDSSAFNFELIFLLLCVRKHFTIVKIFAIPEFSYIAHGVET